MSKLTDAIGMGPNFKQTDVPDLSGRTAVVTGASQGIGLEVARGLALSQCRVLCLSLDQQRGEQAVQELRADVKERTGHEPSIEWRSCDQRDLKAVKACANRLSSEEQRIDLILANAGIGVEPAELTNDGFDTHLTVDHLAEMLLTNRLLPLLRRTAAQHPSRTSCRIVTQSSELHRASKLNDLTFASLAEFKNLMGPNESYARAKLANIHFIKHLAKVGDLGTGAGVSVVRALASHPGVVNTAQQEGFKRAYGFLGSIAAPLVSGMARDPDMGATCMLWCASSPEVDAEGYQATYFDDAGHERDPSSQALDAELEANLWRTSEEVIRQVVGPDALLSWTEQ